MAPSTVLSVSHDKWQLWLQLVHRLSNVHLNADKDKFVRAGTNKFRSLYGQKHVFGPLE
jgi:hypothetical protein